VKCTECKFVVTRGSYYNSCCGDGVETVYSCEHPDNEKCGYEVDFLGRRSLSTAEAFGCVRFECPISNPNQKPYPKEEDYGEI
jgi:hypothetical protein